MIECGAASGVLGDGALMDDADEDAESVDAIECTCARCDNGELFADECSHDGCEIDGDSDDATRNGKCGRGEFGIMNRPEFIAGGVGSAGLTRRRTICGCEAAAAARGASSQQS